MNTQAAQASGISDELVRLIIERNTVNLEGLPDTNIEACIREAYDAGARGHGAARPENAHASRTSALAVLCAAVTIAALAHDPAAADEQPGTLRPAVVGLHLGSLHSSPGWCDANPGVYGRWANGLQAGVYRNSDCGTSAYAAQTWQSRPWHGLRAGVAVGAVTGYRAHRVLPLVLPSVAAQLTQRTSALVAYVPRVEKRGAHALHLMVEVKL